MAHRFLLLLCLALLHPYADNAATASVVIPLLSLRWRFHLMQCGTFDSMRLLPS